MRSAIIEFFSENIQLKNRAFEKWVRHGDNDFEVKICYSAVPKQAVI
jgi:hypothetical protein